MRRIEFFVNVEPIADSEPAHHGNYQKERGHRKIDMEPEVEELFVIQEKPRLVRRNKGEANEDGVDEAKDGLDPSVMPAEHARVRIAWAKRRLYYYMPDVS
jgi:hypothetical protein